jgi:signal peptidase I
MIESATDSPHKSQEDGSTNIKETIESILVAFILAFIFRAFVVEAFVIPTGSMAPTLLGAHMRFRCPDCGYQFDVNYSSPNDDNPDDPQFHQDALPGTDIYCPNCGYLVGSPATLRPVHYGDRILVLKFIYLLHPPERWNVVVFKSPDEPDSTHYTQNFIKRLVGEPGERLMVLDGDIYTSTVQNPAWQIQTKPDSVQNALWRVVYNNDYFPQGLKRDRQIEWTQPWRLQGGSGWDVADQAPAHGNGRIFHFNNPDGDGELRFDPVANSTTQTLTDYLVYDVNPQSQRRPGGDGSVDDERANHVSDLKLSAVDRRLTGSGAFRLKLCRFANVEHTFTAEVTPTDIRLLHRIDDREIEVAKTSLSSLGIQNGQSIALELANVDYRVTLKVNGKAAFAPYDYPPNISWLIAQWKSGARGRSGEAWIEADRQSCAVEHVGLWRDVYYTNRDLRGSRLTTATPDNPVQLKDHEYFVMGDNSAISKDARYWDQRINLPHEGLDVDSGRVPEQFMLGQAVFVYWPAGFRAFDTHLAIIPDFGDMRWIH